MSSKVEKYHNFVVENLANHVEHKHYGGFIFFGEYRVEDTPFRLTAFYPNWRDVFYGFGEMVMGRYGVRKDEVGIIWRKLKVRLNNEYYDSPDGSV